MKTLMPEGTKVTIKVGDHKGNTGKVHATHPEDPSHPYDIMVDGTNGEVWIYGASEVEPLDS